MGAGPYDHPSYLTRQALCLGLTTAGNGGTSLRKSFPNDMRIRNISLTAQVAGTSAGHTVTVRNGTTSIGVATLGTTTINGVTTTGDLNYLLPKGSVLNFLNGTDATGVADIVVEAHVDANSSWVG